MKKLLGDLGLERGQVDHADPAGYYEAVEPGPGLEVILPDPPRVQALEVRIAYAAVAFREDREDEALELPLRSRPMRRVRPGGAPPRSGAMLPL